MPLINGIKMACEPCIRGHRSTKCTHASERLMVPVRKPGRPLSTCPHPSSQPCACSAVTAAIPRKQTCHCGTPSASTPPLNTDTSSSPALGSTPVSPTRANAPHPNRIQKASHKASSQARLSIDAAGLQRMDMNQLNIVSPTDSRPRKSSLTSDGQITPIADVSSYVALSASPANDAFAQQAMLFPMFHPQMPPPMMNAQTMGSIHQDQANSLVLGSPLTNGSSSQIAKPGSCCSGGGSPANATTPKPQSSNIPPATTNGTSKVKSCCAHAVAPKPTDQTGVSQPSSDLKNHSMPNVSMPAPLPHGMFSYFPQPTVFAYPPQYGSYLQPLQPEQWRQWMANLTTTHQQQPPQRDPSANFEIPSVLSYPPVTPGGSAWTSHQCDCGPGCQCVGCAAHPYNDATQDYVRSAWNLMHEESDKRMPVGTNGAPAHVNGHCENGNRENGHRENGHLENGHSHVTNGAPTTNGAAFHGTRSVEGTISPTAPQTPSEGGSASAEDQTLSESDFLFVSYPFGDSCAGDTATCLCGDDCQCIGCVIHGKSDAP